MGNFSLLFGRYDDGGRRFFAATLTSSQIFCYEDLEFYLAFESTVFRYFWLQFVISVHVGLRMSMMIG